MHAFAHESGRFLAQRAIAQRGALGAAGHDADVFAQVSPLEPAGSAFMFNSYYWFVFMLDSLIYHKIPNKLKYLIEFSG
jgi:hypothetical protein